MSQKGSIQKSVKTLSNHCFISSYCKTKPYEETVWGRGCSLVQRETQLCYRASRYVLAPSTSATLYCRQRLQTIHTNIYTKPDFTSHSTHNNYSVSQKNPPCGFLKFFQKWLGIFNRFFTHLLHDHFYTRVQIFIQISPALTKLCHTKRDHLAKFYISLEL